MQYAKQYIFFSQINKKHVLPKQKIFSSFWQKKASFYDDSEKGELKYKLR